MFVASYRNTEAGVTKRNAAETAARRADRKSAELAILEERRAIEERLDRIREQSAERAKAMLAELSGEVVPLRHTYRMIERKACELFGVTSSEIKSNRRNRQIVFVRQFIMYWTARLTKLSLPQIGRLMGGRDHTTVLHGKRKYVAKRAAMGRTLRPVR